MDTPDNPEIDLKQVCDRASLVYYLRLLHVEAGCPTYKELSRRTGGRLATSTIGDLIGKGSENSDRKTVWATVELFIEACQRTVNRADWYEAWKDSVAPGRPRWMDEHDQLHDQVTQLTAQVEQLTAALEHAQTRVADAERARLASQNARPGTALVPSSAGNGPMVVHRTPGPAERLRIRADTYREANNFEGAAELYRQLAELLEREVGPGDLRTLHVWHSHLEAQAEASRSNRSGEGQVKRRRTLEAQWRQLIDAYQRWLPEGYRDTLNLRLRYAYWVAILFDRPASSDMLQARELLIALYADCKIFLPPNDTLTAAVANYMVTEERERSQGTGIKVYRPREWQELHSPNSGSK